jgi:hypothetical protein
LRFPLSLRDNSANVCVVDHRECSNFGFELVAALADDETV